MKHYISLFFLSIIISSIYAPEHIFKVNPEKYPLVIYYRSPDTEELQRIYIKNIDERAAEKIWDENVSDLAEEDDVEAFLFRNGAILEFVSRGWISSRAINEIMNLNPSRARDLRGID